MAEKWGAPLVTVRHGHYTESYYMVFPQPQWEERTARPRKLAVLFPGFGYSCDKPLLHYARRAAEQFGYDVLPIFYPADLPTWDKAALAHSVAACLPSALSAARDAVHMARERRHYTELVFFSKSFGTVVAGALSAELQWRAVRNFYLTPLNQTMPYMEAAPCEAATGTMDPHLSADVRHQMALLHGVTLHICPGANHSLEVPGDAAASVRVLESMVESYLRFLAF